MTKRTVHWQQVLTRGQQVLTRAMVVAALLIPAACGITPDPAQEEKPRESIFGEGGINIFGDDKKKGPGESSLAVNSYLWRASLDVISFMPVTSADAFGGIILTDWHSPDGIAGERFKMNVYIMSRSLRADGVRVSVFRQVLRGSRWADAKVPQNTAAKIEDSILTKARQMRHETLLQAK